MLTLEQKIQEEEYIKPYHYFIEPDSYLGLFYFSYINTCISIINSLEGGKNILDAGCGDGFFINQLDCNKNKIFGLDYSERAIEFAKLFSQNKNVKYHIAPWEKTNLDDKSFDVITNIAVIEHIKPELINACIKETHRILKNGGLFIVALPTHNLKKPAKHFQHFCIEDINKIVGGLFTINSVYGCFDKRFRYLHRFFDNKIYAFKPMAQFLRKKIFAKYFKSTNIKNAEMLVVVMSKKN